MRYVLFVAIVLLSVSCNKKKCWQCKTKVVYGNGNVEYASSESKCDKTKSEIKEYEKQNTVHITGNTTPNMIVDYVPECN